MVHSESNGPQFPLNETAFLSTLRALLAARGQTRAAELLAAGRVSIEHRERDTWNGGTDVWGVTVRLPVPAYAALPAREDIEGHLRDTMAELLREHPNDWVGAVVIAPLIGTDLKSIPGGVSNQANVYAMNPPRLTCDGLHFRSRPEVALYRALKQLDITMAPLPAFVRGSRRLEPDFLLIKDGFVLVVEVDGPDTHHETPVDAERRLSPLRDEGVHVERVYASDCDSDEKAMACAKRLVARFDKYRSQR